MVAAYARILQMFNGGNMHSSSTGKDCGTLVSGGGEFTVVQNSELLRMEFILFRSRNSIFQIMSHHICMGTPSCDYLLW